MTEKTTTSAKITSAEIDALSGALSPLLGIQLPVLNIPAEILIGFEPSQIGTIVGAIMDACIPQLAAILPNNELLVKLGLAKCGREIGERESYPDYIHTSGKRVELKLLYVEPIGVEMKKPPTPREPSARLTQKVTVKNVEPVNDVLLVVAYQLQPNQGNANLFSPTIIDLGVFPMIDCILARDHRLEESGGKWFGNFETPAVLSKAGIQKKAGGQAADDSTYGRKESEGKHYNEDTNFGKLKRIPFQPLQLFLKKHGASYARSGSYPEPWVID